MQLLRTNRVWPYPSRMYDRGDIVAPGHGRYIIDTSDECISTGKILIGQVDEHGPAVDAHLLRGVYDGAPLLSVEKFLHLLDIILLAYQQLKEIDVELVELMMVVEGHHDA